MKRMGDRSRDTAVFGGQLVERGDGLVIAQDDRDLAAGLAVGGGASRPVFGLGHGSDRHVAERVRLVWRDGNGVAGGVPRDLKEGAAAVDVDQPSDLGKRGLASGKHFIEHGATRACWRKDAGRFDGLDLGGRVAVHFGLRLWTTGPSSHVTSDTSTTVCREVFQ